MEDALVPCVFSPTTEKNGVLILVLMEDALVPGEIIIYTELQVS